jgi:hypothetical protein
VAVLDGIVPTYSYGLAEEFHLASFEVYDQHFMGGRRELSSAVPNKGKGFYYFDLGAASRYLINSICRLFPITLSAYFIRFFSWRYVCPIPMEKALMVRDRKQAKAKAPAPATRRLTPGRDAVPPANKDKEKAMVMVAKTEAPTLLRRKNN